MQGNSSESSIIANRGHLMQEIYKGQILETGVALNRTTGNMRARSLDLLYHNTMAMVENVGYPQATP